MDDYIESCMAWSKIELAKYLYQKIEAVKRLEKSNESLYKKIMRLKSIIKESNNVR